MTALNLVEQIELNQITAISRKGDSYTVHYTDIIVEEFNVADKVFTNKIGMNGKLGVSRVLKNVRQVIKERENDFVMDISEEQAKSLNMALTVEGINTFTSKINSVSESKENGQDAEWSIQVVK